MTGPTLRVVTWNVRTALTPERRPSRCWWARRRALAATLSELDADVVALQEAHRLQWRWLVRALAGYRAVATRPRGRWVGEACPLLVRGDRLTVTHHGVAWFGPGGLDGTPGRRAPGAARPRVVAELRLVDRWAGRDLVVLNTHLDPRRTAATAALGHLAGAARSAPADVVAGDLNLGADHLGPVVAAGLTRAPADGTTYHAYGGRCRGVADPAIDHLLVGPRWQVVAAAVVHPPAGRRLASDHWPVAVDLRPR